MGAVAAFEAIYIDRHFLAFKSCSDATDEDDLVDAFQLLNHFGIVDGLFLGHVEFQVGTPRLHMLEAHLYFIRLACLGLNGSAGRCGAPSVVLLLAHAVNIEFKVADGLQIYHILASLLGSEYGLVFGGEVFEVDTWSEVVHACCGDGQGSGIVLSGDRFSSHVGVVPEGAFQTLLAIDGTQGAHEAVHHLVVGAVASWQVEKRLLFGLDAVENGDGSIGGTVVIAPHQGFIVGIGANDGYLLLVLLEGKHIAFVLKQHKRLASHVKGNLSVFL